MLENKYWIELLEFYKNFNRNILFLDRSIIDGCYKNDFKIIYTSETRGIIYNELEDKLWLEDIPAETKIPSVFSINPAYRYLMNLGFFINFGIGLTDNQKKFGIYCENFMETMKLKDKQKTLNKK